VESLLVGHQVSMVCFDYAVSFSTEQGAHLRIESPFRTLPAGAQTGIVADPAVAGESCLHLIEVLHQEIEYLNIDDGGRLTVRFAGGTTIECDPDEEYEAWTLTLDGGAMIVCLSGGGLARWPNREAR
jgi:hypothetical protein